MCIREKHLFYIDISSYLKILFSDERLDLWDF